MCKFFLCIWNEIKNNNRLIGLWKIRASPRLKDADIPEDRLPDLYAELIIATRRMYQHCHLVHADLSDYNIL